MYKKIENEFIKKAYYKKTEIFILIISILVVVSYVIGSKFTYNNIVLQIILSAIILLMLGMFGVLFFLVALIGDYLSRVYIETQNRRVVHNKRRYLD